MKKIENKDYSKEIGERKIEEEYWGKWRVREGKKIMEDEKRKKNKLKMKDENKGQYKNEKKWLNRLRERKKGDN